jgi:hypothetical protein
VDGSWSSTVEDPWDIRGGFVWLSYCFCRLEISAQTIAPVNGAPRLFSRPLAAFVPRPHATRMFVVSEAEATAIRSAFDRGGEMLAVLELRRLFPGIPDNDQARDCARTIASWKPLLHGDRDVTTSRRGGRRH